MAETVRLEEFLEKLDFKPKYKPNGPLKGFSTVFISFETMNGISPHVEFDTEPSEDGTQYFYFEGIDDNRYTEGDMIPLDSDLRIHPTYVRLSRKNLDETANLINSFLKEFSATPK